MQSYQKRRTCPVLVAAAAIASMAGMSAGMAAGAQPPHSSIRLVADTTGGTTAAGGGTGGVIGLGAQGAAGSSTTTGVGNTTGESPAGYRLPPIVATVNGSPVTRDQVDGELEREKGWAQQVVFSLILARLLDQRAVQLGVVPTQAQFQQAYDAANLKAQGQLEQVLARNHMSRAEFEKMLLRPQLEMENIRQQGVKISDADVQQYYNLHSSEWGGPGQVELYRLHTSDLTAANAALAELKAGKGWSAVFKKYSDDKPYYRATEGLYGTVPNQVLPPEITQAIAGLKAGDLSKPMQMQEEGSAHSYIIWKVNRSFTPNAPTLAQKRDEIRRVLATTKARKELDVLGDLVKSAKIEGLPAGFETMFNQFTNPQPPPPAIGFPGGGVPVPPPAGGGNGTGPGGGEPPPPPPPVQ